MSFSSLVKNELSRINPGNNEYLRAEFDGIIQTGSYSSDGKGIRIVTENAAYARRVYMLIKHVLMTTAQVSCRKNNKLKKHTSFTVFSELSYEKKIFDPAEYRSNDELKKSFLRGAFLSSGSVSDPEKTYHLEIIAKNSEAAAVIMELMNDYDLKSKVIRRKEHFIVYIKEGDNIADFLNIIGAHKSLIELENVRILKDMRNSVNRVVNCETANLDKTVNASVRQIHNIEYIKENIGFDNLSESLRQIAFLRLKHREASLKELGEMLNPPIGKSGVNHRIRKLEEIARKYKIPEDPGGIS